MPIVSGLLVAIPLAIAFTKTLPSNHSPHQLTEGIQIVSLWFCVLIGLFYLLPKNWRVRAVAVQPGAPADVARPAGERRG